MTHTNLPPFLVLASSEAGAVGGHGVTEQVGVIFGLLLLAAAVRSVCNRWKLPFTVILVLVGLALALVSKHMPILRVLTEYSISPEVILFVFLPTLVFESAYTLELRQLQKNILPVLTLAIPGLLLSTLIIGGIVALLTDIPIAAALLLGSILSATDPVAVIALFKKLGAPKRLTVLVEGESLFNDATSIVVAGVLLTVATTGFNGETALRGLGGFFVVFFGGIFVGLLLGWVFGQLLQRVRVNADIEISLTMILAYGSFLIAEHYLHVSGVMATLVAGLMMGDWGRTKISPEVGGFMHHFWEYMAFVCNALIFLLVGLSVNLGDLYNAFGSLVVVLVAMQISRAIVIFGLVPITGKFSQTVNKSYQIVMHWGGLRGAIALAIVLYIPDSFPYKTQFTAIVMGAVLFTLIVQATTISRLVRKLGLDQPSTADKLARIEGQISATCNAQQRVPELQAGGLFSPVIAKRLQERLTNELDELTAELENLRENELGDDEERAVVYLHCFGLERKLYFDMFSKQHLSERVYRDLNFSLELCTESMRYHGELPEATIYDHNRQAIRQKMTQLLDRFPLTRAWASRIDVERTGGEYGRAWGRYQGCERVLFHLDKLAKQDNRSVVEEVRSRYETWKLSAQSRIDAVAEQFPEFVQAMQEQLGERLVYQAQREVIQSENMAGSIPDGIADEIIDGLRQRIGKLNAKTLNAQLHVDPSELLRKVPFFKDTPPEEFDHVAGKLREHTVPSGQDIICEGQAGDSLFLIARGVVRVGKDINGTWTELNTLVAGQFFGELALLLGEPRSATCRAVTPCALYELRRPDLDTVRSACPAIQQSLEEVARERLGLNGT
ncbi:Na(+)/H(+) antiporter NhaG [Planctomycetes bacterium CA13]|uniref:Na(+)/H(+) antiporter NhaG n=1 Tax=Novipirellula herctigrandis TaxID=2527986 RepID=A0A5C5YYZ0_9BACT|nr:Na(+)/H(+) antiporter NhaG [Planctomycetes bacterium CA13]